MYYVYILQTEYNEGELYVGCTNDLKRRIVEHNSGKVKSTKKKIPYILIYYEAFLDRRDAFERERFLKSGWGKRFIKKNLQHYFLWLKK